MKRLARLVAVFSIVTLVATACGDDTTTGGATTGTTGGDKKTLSIAFLGALTGDYAQLVIHAKQGAELAIEQANAAGDLPVILELDPQDTGGDPKNATPIANDLKDQDDLVAVVGPAFSGESLAVTPIFAEANIPQVTPSATNPGIADLPTAGTTWFRGVGNDTSQGGPAPSVMFDFLEATSVYVAHDKSAYGQGLAEIVRDGIEAENAEALAGFEGVDAGKKDYSRLVRNVIESDADVFYWGGYSPEGALILGQLRDAGSDVQFLGADGAKDQTFLDGGDAVEGAIVTCPCSDPNASDDEAATQFVSDYQAKFNEAPGVYGGEGYDAANLIIEAIKAAGAPGDDILAYRQAVADGIKATSNFQGITKVYAFQDNGELVDSSVEIFLYKVENGNFTLLGSVADLVG